jgi:very-short-patch-repair endonuclease
LVLKYRPDLKQMARELRSNPTDSERVLWSRLRRKQVLGVQFFRQRPIGDYIVDFYAPSIRLVIEVDGSQHYEPDHISTDKARDTYLTANGLTVLRFSNLDVLKNPVGVTQAIHDVIDRELKGKSPQSPL